MPIMAKYYIADGFSVQAGPQFSFLVKDELISDGNDELGDLYEDNSVFKFLPNILFKFFNFKSIDFLLFESLFIMEENQNKE